MTEAEHALVSAAVTQAERTSDGEIVVVVAPRSDAYHDVGLHYAVLAMLLIPPALAVLPQSWIEWGLGTVFGWNAAPTRAELMILLFVMLAVAFLAIRFLLAWMRLRMMLTPASTKSRRVRRRAIELFRASAEHRTAGRTGILLYLSLLEHRAEIVADQAIHSRVDPEEWGDAMAALVERVKEGKVAEGITIAVQKIGAVLAEHLPASHDNPNELEDRLILL